MRRVAVICAAVLLMGGMANLAHSQAADPNPALAASRSDDPVLEARARDVGRQLRCVVCQNQNIEESDAPLAADMRRMVREQLGAGASEDDVIALMRDRYGDFVLLKPPVQANTIILWGAPIGLVLLILLWWVIGARKVNMATDAPDLTADDEARLRALRAEMDGRNEASGS